MNSSPTTTAPPQALASPGLAVRACPHCDGRVDRVPRHTLDFVISVVVPVGRYRCLSMSCSWEGLMRKRPEGRGTLSTRRRPYL